MIFSALATASNFTAALLIAAEVMWLGWVAVRRRIAARACDIGELHLLPPLLALCAGMALLAPMAPTTGRTSIAAVHAGVLNWSHLRPPWWPLEMLRAASGKAPFMLLLPLATYGGWRMSRDGGGAAFGFVLWWMLVPIALVMAISYAFTPFEEMRYVISSVAAFFILTGIGLAAIDDARWRLGLLVLVVALSLDHVRRDFKKPHIFNGARRLRWRSRQPDASGAIVVVPGYAVNVVRYYLPAERRQSAEDTGGQCETQGRVLILGEDGICLRPSNSPHCGIAIPWSSGGCGSSKSASAEWRVAFFAAHLASGGVRVSTGWESPTRWAPARRPERSEPRGLRAQADRRRIPSSSMPGSVALRRCRGELGADKENKSPPHTGDTCR